MKTSSFEFQAMDNVPFGVHLQIDPATILSDDDRLLLRRREAVAQRELVTPGLYHSGGLN
jgi:hypothetical protein